MTRTALYRLWDAQGGLLYIGIAVDPDVRWRVHRREKTWSHLVAERVTEWFPDRPAAEAAEAAAISSEKPRYNVSHSTTRKRGDAKGEYRNLYAKPRQVRIATQAWKNFGAAAKVAGTTRGRLLVEFVAWYLRKPGAKMPKRPPATAPKEGEK